MRKRTGRTTIAVLLALVVALAGACTDQATTPIAPTDRGPVPSSSAPTPQASGDAARVHAFVDTTGASGKQKFESALPALKTASQLTDVHPTYVECDGTKPVEGVFPEFDDAARSQKLKLAPRLGCQIDANVKRILTNPRIRQRWVGMAEDVARRYDGVVIDFELAQQFTDAAEAQRLRRALVAFVTAVHDAVPKGKYVMTVVLPTLTGDTAISRSAFYDIAHTPGPLFVMAWRKRFDANTGVGALNPLSLVKDAIASVEKSGRARDAVLGMPLYPIVWCDGEATPMTGRELLAALTGARNVVTKHHPVEGVYSVAFDPGEKVGCEGRPEAWYVDSEAARLRAQLALDHGFAGAGFWRLGQELERSEELTSSAGAGFWQEFDKLPLRR